MKRALHLLIIMLSPIVLCRCTETPNQQVVESILTTESDSYRLSPEATSFSVNVSTNATYSVYIAKTDRDWISVADTRAELRDETLSFNVAENTSSSPRIASVEFRDTDDKALATISVTQSGKRPTTTSIHSIYELNQNEGTLNSHADDWTNSSLALDYTSYIDMLPPFDIDLPCYPRVKKLHDGRYMLIYQQNDQAFNIYYAFSRDLINWEDKGGLFLQKDNNNKYKKFEYIGGTAGQTFIPRFTNGDAVVLNDGTIMAVATLRVKPVATDEGEASEGNMRNSGLVVRFSSDNGSTWSDERIVFRVKNWEPYALQLASGEIQIYYTRSNPIKGDSGTAMIASNDMGATWEDRGFVARQQSPFPAVDGSGDVIYTDQMPVARELNCGRGIALAIESRIGSGDSKVYHISMAYSHDNWATPVCVGYNVVNNEHHSNFIQNSGSPYLVQFPSGETALSYNTGGVFNIRVGGIDADFRGVADLRPFPKKASWGSLEIIDSHSLAATFPGAGNIYNPATGVTENRRSIQVGRFVLNHRIDAPTLTPDVDGSSSDWDAVDDALFLGSATASQAAIRFACDADNVYCLVERIDKSVAATDTFDVMIQGGGSAAAVKFTLTPSDDLTYMICSDSRINCKALFKTDTAEGRTGYVAEMAIPRSALSISGDKLYFNAVLHESGTTDTFFGLTDSNYSKWMIVGLD